MSQCAECGLTQPYHYSYCLKGKEIEMNVEHIVFSDQRPPLAALTRASGGVKHDQGKPDYSMISKELMDELAKVRVFGATKYERDNWRKGFKYTRSIAAALRHIFSFKEGEDLDPESGLTHIGHAIACLEHLLNDYKNHPENDDRYKP